MKKCSKANNKPNIIERVKLKVKNFTLNKNLLFWLSFVLTLLFILSPLVLRNPQIRNIVDSFFDPLTHETYKSSFIEIIGSILGTALTITGTLLIQKKIDERAEKEKREKEANDIRYRIIVIYYDLKLAFEDIGKMYNYLVISAFLTEGDKAKNFYEVANKHELYIDDGWIRNVASLHDVFDEKLLEQIFLIYGDICSIRTGLKSNNYDEYQVLRVAALISGYFNGVENGEPQLKTKYIEILEQLKIQGKIIESDDALKI